MKLTLENQPLEVTFACRIEDAWVPVPDAACTADGFAWQLNGAHYGAEFARQGDVLHYTLHMDTPARPAADAAGRAGADGVFPCNTLQYLWR